MPGAVVGTDRPDARLVEQPADQPVGILEGVPGRPLVAGKTLRIARCLRRRAAVDRVPDHRGVWIDRDIDEPAEGMSQEARDHLFADQGRMHAVPELDVGAELKREAEALPLRHLIIGVARQVAAQVDADSIVEHPDLPVDAPARPCPADPQRGATGDEDLLVRTVGDAQVAVERFNLNGMDDMLAAIGGGDLRLNQVVNYIESKHRNEPESEEDIVEDILKKAVHRPKKPGKGQVEVDGVGNLMSHIARCCQPVPGDEIFGYITMGRGISVHRRDCDQVKELMRTNPERAVDVVWGESYSGGYRIKLRVVAHDRSGLLRDLTTVLAVDKSNVMAMSSSSDVKTQTATIDIELELYNLDSLSRVLAKLSQVDGVIESRRL